MLCSESPCADAESNHWCDWETEQLDAQPSAVESNRLGCNRRATLPGKVNDYKLHGHSKKRLGGQEYGVQKSEKLNLGFNDQDRDRVGANRISPQGNLRLPSQTAGPPL